MKLVEPPSGSPTAPTVFVGNNGRGNWVVREQNGIFGGLFVNRAQAFKYALFENGHHPEAIVELSHEIELDIFANDLRLLDLDRARISSPDGMRASCTPASITSGVTLHGSNSHL